MRIAVFGLGYVGAVSAAALASRGHQVIGVDTAQEKVAVINDGQSPISEPGLSELIHRTVTSHALSAVTDGGAAASESEMSIVCVGTPSERNGRLSTAALERVMTTIGEAVGQQRKAHVVVVRSTMVPGTAESVLMPTLEESSGTRVGSQLRFAVNPEFLREGTSLSDFFRPMKTVIGERDARTGEEVASLYKDFPGSLFRLSIRAAEMTKYVDNTFHALKVTFANEIGHICRAFDLDSHEVMESFIADTKLNISSAYLRPGFAFGGSCLPKDLRALLYAARQRDVETPVLASVLASNEVSISRIVETVVASGRRRVGLFGLSFKPGTDDLRESPFVELSERLLGKGFKLKIYDPGVSIGQLVGANRDYVRDHLPHLSALLAESVEEVFQHAEVCIIGAPREEAVRALAESNDRLIVDLARLPDAQLRRRSENYVGVAW